MYGHPRETDLHAENLKEVAHLHGPARKNLIREILEDPKKYAGTDTAVSKALMPPFFYNTNIRTREIRPLPGEPALPPPPCDVPYFTCWHKTHVETPAVYETRVARRIEFIRKNPAPHAAMLVRCLLHSYNYYLVKRFTFLCFVGRYADASEMLKKWNDVNPRSTRNIEAKGGNLSKTMRKGNSSGMLAKVVIDLFIDLTVSLWSDVLS